MRVPTIMDMTPVLGTSFKSPTDPNKWTLDDLSTLMSTVPRPEGVIWMEWNTLMAGRKMMKLCNCAMCLRHLRVSREQAHARYVEESAARAPGAGTSPSATAAGLRS